MRLRFVALVVTCISLSACSKKQSEALPTLYPVKGTITKNKTPVGSGFIRFTPETNQEYIVQGSVDPNGQFELETIQAGKTSKGAPAGTYKVFYNPSGSGQNTEPPPMPSSTFTIEEKPNELTIELLEK